MPTEAQSLRLLTWFSPAFPVGAFGFSHGLETAIREGAVSDADTLSAWITGLLEFGGAWTDALLFKAAWADIPDVAELAAAMPISAERRRETMGQGKAFLAAVRAWDLSLPDDPLAYPVASGRACAAAGLPLDASLTAFLHGFGSNLVSIAMRAIPLGQTDGVRVLAELEPTILAASARAAASTLDDLGACALNSDIAALRHETLDGRLFVS